MGEFGKFRKQTFVDDSYAVPIDEDNLNEIERVCKITDTELKRSQTVDLKKYINYYYNRNVKTIEKFQDNTDWTLSGSTTLSDDTTNKFLGLNSIKCLENDNSSSDVGMYRSISALDLTKFNDGTASDTGDFIVLSFLLSDYTKVNHITMQLGADSSNYFTLSSASYITNDGYWRTIYFKKSSFSTGAGSPVWSNIQYIKVTWNSVASAQNESVSFQFMGMIRKEASDNNYPDNFQKYAGATSGWVNQLYEYVTPHILTIDPIINKLGFLCGDWVTGSNYRPLHVYCSIISFIAQAEAYNKEEDWGMCWTWYVDGINYISVYIESGNLKIHAKENNVSTYTTLALDNTLLYNERYQLFMEKDGDTVRGILKKDGENEKIVEYETSIDSDQDGCVYLGWFGVSGPDFVTDFVVTSTENFKQESWDKPKIVIKKTDENVSSSATMQADDELYMYLPPNKSFEISSKIIADSSSATPDIRVEYIVTGDYTQLTGRFAIAPPTNITDILDSNTKFGYWSGLNFDATHGIDGTGNESIIDEYFYISTGNSGCKVQMQWAQSTSNATATTVKAGSYLKATEVSL
jgi:hypothetical protein